MAQMLLGAGIMLVGILVGAAITMTTQKKD